MTRYRVIHIPTGEYIDNLEYIFNNKDQFHCGNEFDNPSNILDEDCNNRNCAECPWGRNHFFNHPKEYLIEELND